MTDHKFTDDQIIRCLNECDGKENVVAHIVYQGEDELVTFGRILEIINRQKAEIERLESGELREAMTFNSATINRCVASAIKEFAKFLIDNSTDGSIAISDLHDLVKEMTEENNEL